MLLTLAYIGRAEPVIRFAVCVCVPKMSGQLTNWHYDWMKWVWSLLNLTSVCGVEGTVIRFSMCVCVSLTKISGHLTTLGLGLSYQQTWKYSRIKIKDSLFWKPFGYKALTSFITHNSHGCYNIELALSFLPWWSLSISTYFIQVTKLFSTCTVHNKLCTLGRTGV